jgi:hypothetical protein
MKARRLDSGSAKWEERNGIKQTNPPKIQTSRPWIVFVPRALGPDGKMLWEWASHYWLLCLLG